MKRMLRQVLPTRRGVAVVLGSVLSLRVGAQAQNRSARLVERRPGQEGHRRLRAGDHRQGSPKFVPPEERIATFDQDGTLWVEHPMYSQVMYCLERVPARGREEARAEERRAVQDRAVGQPRGDGEALDAGSREDPRRHAHRHVRGRVQRRSEEVDRDRQGSALEASPTPSSPTSRCWRC